MDVGLRMERIVSYWSFNNHTQLGLDGVEGTLQILDDCFGRTVVHPDTTNPAVLQDEVILYALRMSGRARHDFRRLFPSLTVDEQERLTSLLELNPRISALVMDEQKFCDAIQSKDVRSIPVRTSGRRGGKGSRGA